MLFSLIVAQTPIFECRNPQTDQTCLVVPSAHSCPIAQDLKKLLRSGTINAIIAEVTLNNGQISSEPDDHIATAHLEAIFTPEELEKLQGRTHLVTALSQELFSILNPEAMERARKILNDEPEEPINPDELKAQPEQETAIDSDQNPHEMENALPSYIKLWALCEGRFIESAFDPMDISALTIAKNRGIPSFALEKNIVDTKREEEYLRETITPDYIKHWLLDETWECRLKAYKNYVEKITTFYKHGNLESGLAFIESTASCLMQEEKITNMFSRSLSDRNTEWLSRIYGFLIKDAERGQFYTPEETLSALPDTAGTPLFIAGSAHFFGDNGLFKSLQDRGIIISRIQYLP